MNFLEKYRDIKSQLNVHRQQIKQQNQMIAAQNKIIDESGKGTKKSLIDEQLQIDGRTPQWLRNLESKLETIDFEKEYQLIKEKKSELSANLRDAIVFIHKAKLKENASK